MTIRFERTVNNIYWICLSVFWFFFFYFLSYSKNSVLLICPVKRKMLTSCSTVFVTDYIPIFFSHRTFNCLSNYKHYLQISSNEFGDYFKYGTFYTISILKMNRRRIDAGTRSFDKWNTRAHIYKWKTFKWTQPSLYLFDLKSEYVGFTATVVAAAAASTPIRDTCVCKLVGNG